MYQKRILLIFLLIDMQGTYIEVVQYLTEQNSIKPDRVWEVKEHKEKRSLSQNAYYWKLITEVARARKQSVAYIHNTELRAARYAKWFEGELIYVKIPDTDEAEKEVMETMDFHLAPTSRRDGDKRLYVMLRGSSEFNTAEMSHLLDLLIQDAQSLGIETITPTELAKIREMEKENAYKE